MSIQCSCGIFYLLPPRIRSLYLYTVIPFQRLLWQTILRENHCIRARSVKSHVFFYSEFSNTHAYLFQGNFNWNWFHTDCSYISFYFDVEDPALSDVVTVFSEVDSSTRPFHLAEAFLHEWGPPLAVLQVPWWISRRFPALLVVRIRRAPRLCGRTWMISSVLNDFFDDSFFSSVRQTFLECFVMFHRCMRFLSMVGYHRRAHHMRFYTEQTFDGCPYQRHRLHKMGHCIHTVNGFDFFKMFFTVHPDNPTTFTLNPAFLKVFCDSGNRHSSRRMTVLISPIIHDNCPINCSCTGQWIKRFILFCYLYQSRTKCPIMIEQISDKWMKTTPKIKSSMPDES